MNSLRPAAIFPLSNSSSAEDTMFLHPWTIVVTGINAYPNSRVLILPAR